MRDVDWNLPVRYEVFFNEAMSDRCKLMYSLIEVLSIKDGFCTAKDYYFSKVFNISKKTVSRDINTLKKLGFVKVKNIKDHEGFINSREITPKHSTIERLMRISEYNNKIVDSLMEDPGFYNMSKN